MFIRGRHLFEGGVWSRKYGICLRNILISLFVFCLQGKADEAKVLTTSGHSSVTHIPSEQTSQLQLSCLLDAGSSDSHSSSPPSSPLRKSRKKGESVCDSFSQPHSSSCTVPTFGGEISFPMPTSDNTLISYKVRFIYTYMNNHIL